MRYSELKFQITKLMIYETGGYDDQFRRPFVTDIDEQHIMMLNGSTQNGELIDPNTVAGVAGQIMRPAPDSEILIPITAGWSENRCRFQIEVSAVDNLGCGIRRIMTGWTDHYGVSTLRGDATYDHRMKFYINNTITIRDIRTDRGIRSSIIGNQHVLIDSLLLEAQKVNQWSGIGEREGDYSIRPEDVYRHGAGAGLLQEEIDAEYSAGSPLGRADTVHNFSSTFVGGPKLTRRSEARPSRYLSSMLKASRSATDSLDEPESAGMTDVNAKASSFVVNQTPAYDQFIAALMRMFNYHNTGYFTYGDLCEITDERELDNITIHHQKSSSRAQSLFGLGVGLGDWGDSTTETQIATQILNIIPGLMVDNALNLMHFHVSNHSLNGDSVFTIVDENLVQTICDGVDPYDLIGPFERQLISEVMPGLTHNNDLGLDISVLCDTFGETVISVSVNGNPEVDYRAPSFCDSLMSPLLTRDSRRVDALYRDFDNLNGNLGIDMDFFAPQGHSSVRAGGSGWNPGAGHSVFNNQNNTLGNRTSGAGGKRWQF